MISFFRDKLLQSLLSILLLVVVVFFAVQVVGDPVRLMLPPAAAPEVADNLREELGLNRSLWSQFASYLGGAARLDFGDSLRLSVPASELVLDRIPNTAVLAVAAMGLAVPLGIGLGIAASLGKGKRRLDRVITGFATVASSSVDFWIALLLVVFVAQRLGLPTQGLGYGRHLLLPAIALAFRPMGRIAEVTRTAMVRELRKDYITSGLSRGLSERRIVLLHAARNAMVSVVTLAGWEFARIFTGAAVVIEAVFGWPGIGTLAVTGIVNRDLPIVVAVTVIGAGLVIVLHLLIDLLHGWIDPRVRYD